MCGCRRWIVLRPWSALPRAWRSGSELFEIDRSARFGNEPLIERCLTFHDHHAGAHGGMRVATKLGAVDLVAALFGRRKPSRGAHSRNGVLSDSHGNHLE